MNITPTLPFTAEQFAACIDHTLLKPGLEQSQIALLCREAVNYSFASVCVNPFWIRGCAQLLKSSSVKVCSVIGFPLGESATEIKVKEAMQVAEAGAEEIDMVINQSLVLAGRLREAENEIQEVLNALSCTNRSRPLLKVIIESDGKSTDYIQKACHCVAAAGADFCKTSTGFQDVVLPDGKSRKGGATIGDITLMVATLPSHIGIKASGGVRTLEAAQRFISEMKRPLSLCRIGTSNGVKIMEELQTKVGNLMSTEPEKIIPDSSY